MNQFKMYIDVLTLKILSVQHLIERLGTLHLTQTSRTNFYDLNTYVYI